jgi:hypothetical protein
MKFRVEVVCIVRKHVTCKWALLYTKDGSKRLVKEDGTWSGSAAYSNITAAPHEYFYQTGS